MTATTITEASARQRTGARFPRDFPTLPPRLRNRSPPARQRLLFLRLPAPVPLPFSLSSARERQRRFSFNIRDDASFWTKFRSNVIATSVGRFDRLIRFGGVVGDGSASGWTDGDAHDAAGIAADDGWMEWWTRSRIVSTQSGLLRSSFESESKRDDGGTDAKISFPSHVDFTPFASWDVRVVVDRHEFIIEERAGFVAEYFVHSFENFERSQF